MKRQIRSRWTALLLAIILILPSFSAAAATAEMQQDETNGFYVNLPANGSDTLDLTDKTAGFSFKIFDDGGANGDYSSSENGTLLITAPDGCLLKVSGNGYTESGYDYLYLYEGDTTVPLSRDSYCGSFSVEETYSSSNRITVRFTSDSSSVYSGFELDVTVIDADLIAAAVFSYAGTTKRLTADKGTQIALPLFSDLFTAPVGSTFIGWNCDGTTYAEGESFTVTQDVTFEALVEEPPVVLGSDEDGWYANMPTSGTATADLSDKQSGFTLHVYDDGGADSSYSDYCNGYLRIVAPADCILRVSGSGVSESGYDWVILFDGDGSGTLGAAKYQGTFTVPELFSSSNVMKLFFRSDSSGIRAGFDLAVTVVDLSSFAFLSFAAGEGGGSMDSVRAVSGEKVTVPECSFTLPEGKLFSHWTDGENDYYPGSVVTISADLALTAIYNFKATVTYLFGEETQTVDVAQGALLSLPSFASVFTLPERKTFTGWQCGETLYAENDSFTVTGDVTFTAVIEADPVVLHGETGTLYANYENYALLPKTVSVTADLTAADPGYLLWVFDNGGVGSNYSNNCDGSITVLAPEGCIMQISSDLNTELGCDYLYVYDGDSTSAALIGSFSGTNGTGKLYSTGSAVTLRFTSDGGYNRRGIDMKITVTVPSSLVTVSFDPGAGSGTMDDIVLLPGDWFYIPYNSFTVPDGYLFDHYTDGETNYTENQFLYATEDLCLSAVYIEKITITYRYGEATYVTTYKKGAKYSVRSFNAAGFTLPYRKDFKCWLDGETEVASQTYLYANEDITYTPVFNDLPYLIEDGDGGYYATVPKDEHVTLDLSDRQNGFSFTLYDDGGTNSYSNNCDGSMTIVAPVGYVLMFSGTVKTEGNGADSLIIYDSDLTTMLGEGAYSVDSNTDIGELFSTGTSAKVCFRSNDYYYAYGFILTVKLVDPSTLITVSFEAGEGASGTMKPLTQIAGEPFTLPDYGFTPPENKIFAGYSDGTDLFWPGTVSFSESKTLTALWAEATGITYAYGGDTHAVRYAKGSTVTLPAFTDVLTLPAGMHFVGWQEKFSGDLYQAGDAYVIDDPTVMTAILEILYDDGNGGYYALTPVNNPNANLTLDLSDKPNGFSFTLYDDGGSDGNYADYNDGVLIVKAPENMVVTVSGSGRIENNYDYLRFYDGPSSSSSIIGNNKYSNYVNIYESDPVTSTGNYLMIYFHSDSSDNYEGYALTVTVLAQVTVTYEFDGETEVVAVQKDSTIHLAYFGLLFTSETKEFLHWQSGGDTFASGDEYFVDGDVTFTAVTRLKPTATLDGNGAAVLASIGGDGVATTLGPIPYYTGSTESLPHAIIAFDIPEGRYFGGWECGGEIYAPGDEFTITEDVTFTAIWRDATAWERLNDSLQTSGSIALTEDVKAVIGSLPLTVPAGVTATIDLNGYTLDGTMAAWTDGNMILVHGDLTVTDSAASGAFTGGGVTVYTDGAFTADGSAAAMFAATVAQRYRANDDDYNYENFIYSVSWYPTLADALDAASIRPDYEDSLTLPDGMYFRWYLMPKVALLQDVTVAEGETLEINTDEGIDLDLNGHTFDVQGTFTGGTSFWRYNDGDPEEAFNPTDVCIDSTTPGVFRSSGTIGVNLQPWTGDTYYFTGGTVNGFIGADGGTFFISGGHFTEIVMFNNGNEDASIEVTISGDAQFDRLEYMIYSDPDYPAIHMTISENARIAAMLFEIMGQDTVNDPLLTVNGGYFSVDPRTWLTVEGAGENAVSIEREPEAYDGQTDWAADGAVYVWRISDPVVPGDLNGDGAVTGADAIYLLYFTFYPDDYPVSQDADFNHDGDVTGADAIYLLYFTFYPDDYPLV